MSENKIPFVTVIYEEPDVKTYKGIGVLIDDNEIFKINTGDFDKDYYVTLELLELLKYRHFLTSSSINHFYMDRENVDEE